MISSVDIVRAVMLQHAGPLSAGQIGALGEISPDNVRHVLNNLERQGEVRLVAPGNGVTVAATYERTPGMRRPESSLEAERAAAAFLQKLVLAWGGARPNDRRDCHAPR